MRKTLDYTTSNLKLIYDNLSNLSSQGKSKDFQIKIDDFICVERTNDLKKFYLYQKSLTPYSNEVLISIFIGKSRCADRYLLVRNGNKSPDPNLTPQEYIDQEVSKALKLQHQQMEYARLKEKTKSQKKTIKYLEKRLQELESKGKGEIQSILKMLTSQFGLKQSIEKKNDIAGIPNDELVEMLQYYRNKLGDEVFAKSLGIIIKAAEHPEILDELELFINNKIKKDESEEA